MTATPQPGAARPPSATLVSFRALCCILAVYIVIPVTDGDMVYPFLELSVDSILAVNQKEKLLLIPLTMQVHPVVDNPKVL